MPRNLAHVSSRRIAANRQNALKSAGPKTSSGKTNGQRNSLKHGLFPMYLYVASLTEWEYQKFLDRLIESYQPIRSAAELEVQIVVCWWKRAQEWNYENVAIALQLCVQHCEVGRRWERISSVPHRGPSRPHRAADQRNALKLGRTSSKNRSHSVKISTEEVRGDGA
jgi:hypothetical protein